MFKRIARRYLEARGYTVARSGTNHHAGDIVDGTGRLPLKPLASA